LVTPAEEQEASKKEGSLPERWHLGGPLHDMLRVVSAPFIDVEQGCDST
jgi:hypothetical protein